MIQKRMRGKLLLVDGNNLLHRAFHKFSNMQYQGKPTGAIFGFFRTLTPLLYKYQPKRVIVVFDSKRSKFRESIHPEYKATRVKLGVDRDSLFKQMGYIKKMLTVFGIDYIHDIEMGNDWEADDYIAYLALKSIFNTTIILSSDKDYNQIIGNHIKVHNPSKEKLITKKNCKTVFGYKAKQTVDWLTLVGDASDNIKGVPGYGEKRSKEILEEWGTLNKALDNKAIKYKTFNQEIEILERIRVCRDLIDIRKHIYENAPLSTPIEKVITISDGNKVKKKGLQKYTEMFGLKSFYKEEFLEAYKEYNKTKVKWDYIESCWQGHQE